MKRNAAVRDDRVEENVALRRVGRPKRAQSNQLEQQILTAAENSFVERGFGATTIKSVAEDCGTTRRSVFHRFPDRDSLLLAVADRHLSVTLDVVLETFRGTPDPLERLRLLLRHLLGFAIQPLQIGLIRVYVGEINRLPKLSERFIQYNVDLESAMATYVADAQKSGYFRGHSPENVATAAASIMISNPFNRAMLGDPAFRNPEEMDRYFSRVWAIFAQMA